MPNDNAESLEDANQLGLVAAVGSLGYVFWVLGGMEMVERLAYYGVRSVSGLYVTNPVSEGGLGVGGSSSTFSLWSVFRQRYPGKGDVAK